MQAFKERKDDKQRESIDAAVAEKVKAERAKIAFDTAKREQAIRDREAALLQDKERLDFTIAETLKLERAKVAADELKRARLELGNDLEQKNKELADLSAVLKKRDEKLAEAQKSQAQIVVRQRDLMTPSARWN